MREELLALLRKAGMELLRSIPLRIVLIVALFAALLVALIWIAFRISARSSSGLIANCPHCGSPAGFRTFQNYDGSVSYETAAVVCSHCGAQTKEEIISGYYGISVTPEDIIQKWNRRCGR